MKRKALGTFDPFLSEADNKARNYTYNRQPRRIAS